MVAEVSSREVQYALGEQFHPAAFGMRLAGLVLLGLLVGCGGRSDMAPVSGVVTVDGKPVAAAQVLFTSPNRRPAVGETDAEGRYVLSTHEQGDGAAIGSYNVTVTARPTIQLSAAGSVGPTTRRPVVQHGPKSPVPLKYSDAANPLLTVEVKPGENEIPFELKQN